MFTIAKATKLSVLQSIRGELDRALAEGTTFRTFQQNLIPRLRKLGWWGKKALPGPDGTGQLVQLGSVRRLKTIFRTNLATAYNAGRYKQQLAGAQNELAPRPWLQYIAVIDPRTRHQHRELHGKVFRYDDPFWDTFYPPNGWNCRCRVRALSDRDLQAAGLKPESSKGRLKRFRQQVAVNKQTGEVLEQPATRYRGHDVVGRPFAIAPDAGFGHNPGRGWAVWDKRGALPDQVGGRGKGVAIIEPDQKTYRDYGLPSAREYPAELVEGVPALLPKAESRAAAEAQIAAVLLGDLGVREVKTPLESIIIQRRRLPHLSEKQKSSRERYANLIMPAVTDPNEIWLTAYKDGFRRRFIKLFKADRQKSVVVIVRENIDGGLFWNAIPTRHRYIDRQRTGVLLYRKTR